MTVTTHGVGMLSAFEPAGGGGSQGVLPAGTRIGHYEVIRQLGRGGMGVVYAARDLKLGRRVAIKFLSGASGEESDRFIAEVRATAKCNHENIVIIHGADEHDGVPYMVLELIEGQSLRDLIDAWGKRPMPASRVVELVLPIARALTCAHGLEIVHRDLKPENVLVTTTGQVKVVDFGIAKACENTLTGGMRTGAWQSPMNQTADGAILGTLPYMSPEQLTGDADHRSDLFATGVMMFELLAGRHPVEPLTTEALFENLADDAPMVSVGHLVPELPRELVQLVDRCLAKRADDRISSATELAAALEVLLPHRTGRRLAEGESPYPGLVAFQASDANRFFGRGRDVGRLLARIRELPLTGVVGPSGIGKSSFVRAGIGPALEASDEGWELIDLRPGRHPLDALATVLVRAHGGAQHPRDVQELASWLGKEPGRFGAGLRARASAAGRNILLFVDQLEELYTLTHDAAERRAFTAALIGAADDHGSPVRVIVSMRSDLLDRVAEDREFMDELMRGLVLLPSPDRDSLREALVQPLELVGHRFESPTIVDEMIDALADAPGALPLLQFAAGRLWDARDRERRLLTVASYHAIGGISGALASHADEVVAALGGPARAHMRAIFRRLVTPERTRAIVQITELAEGPDRDAIGRVIDTLVAARLLVSGESGAVEIVHESLIDRWPTLRRWLDEDHEDAAFVAQLSAAAKQWDVKGRPSGLLWRAEAMEEARRWAAQRPRELSARDRAFLDAVLALARRGRRRRRFALVTAFASVAAIAVVSFGGYLYVRDSEATIRQALDRSEQANREAEQRSAEARRARAKEVAAAQERDRAVVEARHMGSAVEQSQEELEKTNRLLAEEKRKLELSLTEAKAARREAERAAEQARQATVERERALAAEKARHEETRRKLATMSTSDDLKR